jgi:hypothetical protein
MVCAETPRGVRSRPSSRFILERDAIGALLDELDWLRADIRSFLTESPAAINGGRPIL